MRRVLVLFAHPVLERSRVNRRLVEAARDLEGVTLRDMYEEYPTLDIDVRREQEMLLRHDVVVFQHPFYWYSVPAILKEWQDLVLEHGWAYGAGGTHLRGKVTFNVVSTGGPASAYRESGYNRFTVRELLAPWDQTAHLCGMRFLAPFVVHASLAVIGEDDVAPARVKYRRLLEALRDDRIDLDRAAAAENLVDSLDHVLAPREVA
ncbi:MAG: NAD(P)H-dependent oxidoreductase [Deltaproteobacteria bacterium]|nr:NAD(P)H-dependent oxidoreductase [Deltaproteobacteria bacterium]MCW5803725.1 NAD(P)H-dependent oxidoreductase [Deltaproteobacteria bacterium]